MDNDKTLKERLKRLDRELVRLEDKFDRKGKETTHLQLKGRTKAMRE